MDTTLEKIMLFLQGKMETPTWFGWYHILWLGIMVASCVLIYIFRKKFSDKTVSNILLVLGIILILFEVYKQLIYSFHYVGEGNSTWNYQWYAFPFQFCSTPMYLFVLAGIIRKGRIHDNLLCYLATFALFGGLCVMIYPGDVFTKTIGINIQTMFWHSSMVVAGFMILATKKIKLNLISVFKATEVFAIMIILALGMNIIWHYYGDPNQTFNMFFISPYYECSLPILNVIYAKVHYAIFLIIYLVGFVLAACVMMLIAMFLNFASTKVFKKKDS